MPTKKIKNETANIFIVVIFFNRLFFDNLNDLILSVIFCKKIASSIPLANKENYESSSSSQKYFPFPFRPLLLFHDGYVYQLYGIPPDNLNHEKRPQMNSMAMYNFDNQQVRTESFFEIIKTNKKTDFILFYLIFTFFCSFLTMKQKIKLFTCQTKNDINTLLLNGSLILDFVLLFTVYSSTKQKCSICLYSCW